MIYTVRPAIAVLLLTVGLLSGCDGGDAKQDSASSSAGAKPRWQKLAAECPAFAGAAATGVEPVDEDFRPFDGKKLYAVGCNYRATESRGWKVALNVTLYRTTVGERSPDLLAAYELDRSRRATDEYSTEGATSEALTGVGDGGFARLVPGRGARVYVRTANAMVQLDYADPGDSRQALAKATDLTRQALSVLR